MVHLLAARDVQNATKYSLVSVPQWWCKSAVSAVCTPAWKPTLSRACNRAFWETAWSWAKKGMYENLLQEGFQMDTFSLAMDRSRDHKQADGRNSVCVWVSVPFSHIPFSHLPIQTHGTGLSRLLSSTVFAHYPCKALFFFFAEKVKTWRGVFPVPVLYSRLLNHPTDLIYQTQFEKIPAAADDLKQGLSSSQELLILQSKTDFTIS